MNEQLHLDDRLDKFKNVNSAQARKEKAETLRNYFRIPDKFSASQILAKEKILRKEYQTKIKDKEEDLGFVMGNIAEGMLQQAFYGGDQSTDASSQKQMTNVLQAVSDEEARNTENLKTYIEQTKQDVVKTIFK